MSSWREHHGNVIYSFLHYLNARTNDFVLKGGTALMTCYNLDRFSEDIDLDSKNKKIESYVDGFCQTNGFSYRVAKDTDTVKRFMIYYGNKDKPLKVEVSYRRKEIMPSEFGIVGGICVYNINSLCTMKASAYASRDKIRDLYDLSFICNNFFDALEPQRIDFMRNVVEYKGIEQFDYIVREQKDELINENMLADAFLKMYDKLGLLYDNEKTIVNTLGENRQNNSTNTCEVTNESFERRHIADIMKDAKEKADRINREIANNSQKNKGFDR